MKKETLSRAAVLLFVVLAAIAGFNWQTYTEPPTRDAIEFQSPYAACADEEGNYYIIDASLTRILKISQDGQLLYKLVGLSEKPDGFFRASLLAAHRGTLYITDNAKNGSSRLLALDADSGTTLGVIYETADGYISAVRADDTAYFAVSFENNTKLYRIGGLSGELISEYAHGDLYETEFAISACDESLYFATMTGDVYHVTDGGAQKVFDGFVSMDNLDGGSLARWISVDEHGALMLADSAARTVLSVTDGETRELTQTNDTLLDRRIYSGLYAINGGFVALASKLDEPTELIRVDANGSVLAAYISAGYGTAHRAASWILWIILGMVAAAILFKLVSLVIGFARKKGSHRKPGETTVLALGLGSFSVIVLLAIAIVLLPGIRSNTDNMVMDNLSSLSYMAAQLPVGDAINRIRDIDDYEGQDYRTVESELNQLLTSVKDSELEYYYVLYTTDRVYGVTLIDSTGDYKMFQLQPRPFMGSDTQIYGFDQGIQMNYDTFSDETGDWAFSVTPIRDSSGTVVAIIEVGVNSYTVRSRNDAAITGLLFAILTLVVILFMSYTELLSFIDFLRTRRTDAASRLTGSKVLRPLSFLVFVACSLQSAFVAILASRLYTPIFGLPSSVAIAIPVSASLFTTSIFGIAGGYLIGRLGIRRTLIIGVSIIAGAFALIWATLSFEMLIIGRLLSGIGMGLTAVGLNALASAGDDEQSRATAFTGYNTGMTAGVNIGTVLGSQLVGWLGYANIYLIAALVLVAIAVFVFAYVPKGIIVREKKTEDTKLGAGRFLINKRVWSFFLCVFLPYTVCSYFLYYFFPLFADRNGMSEANIGRFYLLAGLIVVNCGPSLTRFMLKTFGSFLTNVMANLLYAAVFVWFALSPTMEMAVIAIVLLSLFDSFGFSAQSVYYSGLEAVERFGTGKAMGVFSMMENIAQTAAPFLFGFGLTLGTGLGITALGLFSAVLLPVYFAAGYRRKERPNAPTAAGE